MKQVLYDPQTTESEKYTEKERGSTEETRIGGSPRERRQRREDKRQDAGRRSGDVKTDRGRKRSSCPALSGVKHHHKYNLIRSESAYTHTHTHADMTWPVFNISVSAVNSQSLLPPDSPELKTAVIHCLEIMQRSVFWPSSTDIVPSFCPAASLTSFFFQTKCDHQSLHAVWSCRAPVSVRCSQEA